MHEATRVWDVKCAACDVAIGQILGERFVHDPECPLPRRIEGGSLRCCRCGGVLHGEERTLVEHAPAATRRVSSWPS